MSLPFLNSPIVCMGIRDLTWFFLLEFYRNCSVCQPFGKAVKVCCHRVDLSVSSLSQFLWYVS